MNMNPNLERNGFYHSMAQQAVMEQTSVNFRSLFQVDVMAARTKNILLQNFPDSFNDSMPFTTRDIETIKYLCQNFSVPRFRLILRATELVDVSCAAVQNNILRVVRQAENQSNKRPVVTEPAVTQAKRARVNPPQPITSSFSQSDNQPVPSRQPPAPTVTTTTRQSLQSNPTVTTHPQPSPVQAPQVASAEKPDKQADVITIPSPPKSTPRAVRTGKPASPARKVPDLLKKTKPTKQRKSSKKNLITQAEELLESMPTQINRSTDVYSPNSPTVPVTLSNKPGTSKDKSYLVPDPKKGALQLIMDQVQKSKQKETLAQAKSNENTPTVEKTTEKAQYIELERVESLDERVPQVLERRISNDSGSFFVSNIDVGRMIAETVPKTSGVPLATTTDSDETPQKESETEKMPTISFSSSSSSPEPLTDTAPTPSPPPTMISPVKEVIQKRSSSSTSTVSTPSSTPAETDVAAKKLIEVEKEKQSPKSSKKKPPVVDFRIVVNATSEKKTPEKSKSPPLVQAQTPMPPPPVQPQKSKSPPPVRAKSKSSENTENEAPLEKSNEMAKPKPKEKRSKEKVAEELNTEQVIVIESDAEDIAEADQLRKRAKLREDLQKAASGKSTSKPKTSSKATGESNFVIRKIINSKVIDGRDVYKCRYVGLTPQDDQWHTVETMEGSPKHKKALIDKYTERRQKRSERT